MKMKKALLFLPFFCVLNSETPAGELNESGFSAGFTWEPVRIPFPLAWGVSIDHTLGKNWAVGLEYLRSSRSIGFFTFDIGEVNEQSLTLQFRRFVGQSFSLFAGVGQRRNEVTLGANLFNVVSTDSITASKLRTNFLQFGMGSRWDVGESSFISVDWFSLDIPFSGDVTTSSSRYARSESAGRTIRNAEDILKYYPSGTVLGLALGITF